MARIPRVVVPGAPHHITQRGVRRMQTFFDEEDYQIYLNLMCQQCQSFGVEIWSYCLMPNHAHLIAVPKDEKSLSRGIGEAHRRYTRHVNFKKSWKGYLWQGRFASFPMDESYLLAAVRYVELNPVRAKLVKEADDYRWSSAKAHLDGKDDVLVKVEPLLERVPDWREFLASGNSDGFDEFHKHERSGRPLGDEGFVSRLSRLLARDLARHKPGPKQNN